jgi:hypothetical protein
MLQDMPAGLSIRPTGSFTPTPTPDAPFVGRLDQFAASMPGPMKKDQLLGTIGNKFKGYELERARRALEGLPDDARVAPNNFLNRLSEVNNPAAFRTTVIDPEPSSFFQQMDNVFFDSGAGRGGELGVIHLHRFTDPAQTQRMTALDEVSVGLNHLARSKNDPESFEALLGWARQQPDAQQLEQVLTTGPVARSRQYIRQIDEVEDMLDDLLYPNISKEFGSVFDRTTQSLAEPLIAQGAAPFSARLSVYDEAHRQAMEEVMRRGVEKWNALGLSGNPIERMPLSPESVNTPWANDSYSAFVRKEAKNKKDQLRELSRSEAEEAMPALRAIEDRVNASPERPYMGQHPSLRNPVEPISFSRFSEHTTSIPGVGERKGIYVHELQSDLLDDLRKGNVPATKEAFPDMAKQPQVIQQLMIKNSINAAMQRGDQFVAFPGVESKQAQLYEKLPRNLKEVAKELGEGFEVRPIELTLPGGEKAMFEGVTWSPEAVQRTQKQGIPFAKGGMVERKTSDNRSYK